MGTDFEKTTNRARMWGTTCVAMTLGIWEMVEDSSLSLSPVIGANLLRLTEKQFGLEVAGENPEHILTELARIFVDEYGYCTEADVKHVGNVITCTLKHAAGYNEFQTLREHKVEKIFSHPFLCTGMAALARLGVKSRPSVDFDDDDKGFTVKFELLG